MRVQRAFTLVELLVVVMMLGVLATIAVPRLPLGALHRGKAEAAAAKIVTDLRLARQLAISNAATNTKGFELDMIGHAPYGAYEIVNKQDGQTVVSHIIDPSVACKGTSKFKFGPLGNLGDDDHHHSQLTVSADGKSVAITVVPATGMVKCE